MLVPNVLFPQRMVLVVCYITKRELWNTIYLHPITRNCGEWDC